MSEDVKFFAALLVGFALLCSGAAGAGACWSGLSKRKLASQHQKATAEGSAFGAGRTAVDCLDEALVRAERCKSLACRDEGGLFARACLAVALPTAEECAGAPQSGNLAQAAVWAADRCLAFGRGNDLRCANLVRLLQDQCLSPGGRRAAP